ncbi:sensor histidine kinase [Patulibacter minatonensis]|uniref:sensor histidine kinase n=1 Tax=Patulibacter minatonensis TaxID=298163 RepID=UPI00047EA416|nr:sensor histidine kinase [Patulibacter minatonensis]
MSSSSSPTVGAAPPDAPASIRPRARAAAVRGWNDALYLVLGGVTGTAIFSLGITLIATTTPLLVLIVGIPLAVVTSTILRWCAELERRRALLVDDVPIRGDYRPLEGSLLGQAATMARDPRRWADALWSVVQFPFTLAGFVVAVSAWGTALGFITLPAWYAAVPDTDVVVGLFDVDTLPAALLVALLGVVLVPVAWWLTRAATIVNLYVVRLLLGDDLKARVAHLEETRAGAVDAASTELRRIERDLHDGAQARMVAVAMDLGMAEERIERDPEGARELVRGARDEARRALTEMRDLVRGIAPSVLQDRGLEAALSSLAARAPVPVTVDVDLPGRPPASAETGAYFVVAEALVNVARHSGASAATVEVRRELGELVARVRDDGRGGASAVPGGGLAGLRDRVAALDGILRVTSPEGGPTTIEARIPCAS